MRPASDTVSAFYACLLAQRWEDAVSLLDPVAVQRYRDAYLTHEYGLLDLPDTQASASQGNPLLARLADRQVHPGLGVSTTRELFTLTPEELLARLLAVHARGRDGRTFLPWNGRRIQILSETLVLQDIAEVRFAYLGQPEDMTPDELRWFQKPWTIRLRLVRDHWRMELPQGILHPDPR